MKSGYKILWTDHALDELEQTFGYLQLNFSEKEIGRLAYKIESVLQLILTFPELYPESARQKGLRRAVITKFNTLYYRIKGDQIEILSFFSNRQNPDNLRPK